jgi:hypothetical protein
MDNNQYKIVRITNIADFDFTGEMGSRYDQTDYFVPAGKSLLVPYVIGNHLATHLARQIIMRKTPIRDEANGRGSDAPLWNDETIENLKKKILAEVYEEEPEQVLSSSEALAKKVLELNKNITEKIEGEEEEVLSSNIGDKGQITYKDKKQVIDELTKKGIKFNPRETKVNLERLLYMK